MKKVALMAFCGVASLVSFSSAASANDGTITFNGLVTANTCVLAPGGGASGSTGNILVKLPTVRTVDFAAATATAGDTKFALVLSDGKGGPCVPGGTGKTNAHVYFDQGPNVDIQGRLINIAPAGAQGVQVELLNSAGVFIKLGAPDGVQADTKVTLDTVSPTILNYTGRYRSSQAAVTAGPVDTSVTYTVVYN